jgi:hypothetical protein
MEQRETVKLSERAYGNANSSLEERLRSILQLGQGFDEFLLSNAVLFEDQFVLATFNLMRVCCRLTNADGASLYSSRREGYLDRQAFCSDPDLSYEQIRSASQVTEHVAVGEGIAGYIALDREKRKELGYDLKYPIESSNALEIWDICAVEELPEQLRRKNTELMNQGVIDISSMLLIKKVGINGVDLILQLVRETRNGSFSNEDRLVSEIFAGLIFPCFRDLELYRKSTNEISSSPASASYAEADVNTTVQRIAADACEAIKAIATAAIDKAQKTSMD